MDTQSSLLDLAAAVKGMYRLLDLINDSGSNGSVDKVVITRQSPERFVNTRCPGAYASITKVDFKTLDRLMIKPPGVCGSAYTSMKHTSSLAALLTWPVFQSLMCFCEPFNRFQGVPPELLSTLVELGYSEAEIAPI